MTSYELMFEAINEQYDAGKITFEQADELNRLAYDKYMTETSKETKAKRDELLYGTSSGKLKHDARRRSYLNDREVAYANNEDKKSLEKHVGANGNVTYQYNRKSPDNSVVSDKRKQLMDKLDRKGMSDNLGERERSDHKLGNNNYDARDANSARFRYTSKEDLEAMNNTREKNKKDEEEWPRLEKLQAENEAKRNKKGLFSGLKETFKKKLLRRPV